MAQDNWKQEKEETNCQAPDAPIMCTNNCGFFGSAVTLGMCSKCYRDFVLTQAKSSSGKGGEKGDTSCAAQKVAVGQRGVERTQGESVYLGGHVGGGQTEGGGTSSGSGASASGGDACRPQAHRCFSCKKRVGLTGFKCRCGNTFCSLHRYSDKHSCTFDYKTAGRDAIAKANPVVKADKVDKI